MIAIKHISLERVLQFLLGPIPLFLATSDGTPAKTDKSKLMHCLELVLHISEKATAEKNFYILDDNAMFQSRVALPTTFGQFADSPFALLTNVHYGDLITYLYFHNSIKSIRRNKRRTSATNLIKG